MPMTCPSCGRGLASGAKCLFCGPGQIKKQYTLDVPKGSTRPPKKSIAIPWKTIFVLLLLGGGAFFVSKNPEWMAKIKELIKF